VLFARHRLAGATDRAAEPTKGADFGQTDGVTGEFTVSSRGLAEPGE
jgi:hypothetical protein